MQGYVLGLCSGPRGGERGGGGGGVCNTLGATGSPQCIVGENCTVSAQLPAVSSQGGFTSYCKRARLRIATRTLACRHTRMQIIRTNVHTKVHTLINADTYTHMYKHVHTRKRALIHNNGHHLSNVSRTKSFGNAFAQIM